MSKAIVVNWKALDLLSDPGLSRCLYSTLLEEKKLLVQALAELLLNSEAFNHRVKKEDTKVFGKGSVKKKRELLLTRRYRLKVVPKICEAGLKYLKDGSDQDSREA